MSRFKTALMAMVAVFAIGAVGASAAQATGVDSPSKVGLSGAYCNITSSGPSLAPSTTASIPANGISSSGCPFGVLSATNSTALSVSTTASDLTLNSGTIRVRTFLGSCDITVASPVTIPYIGGSYHYQGSVPIPDSRLTLSGAICPTSGSVDLDLWVS